MIRHLALFLLAISTPLSAQGNGRGFTITSFDRIRVEAPYAVSLSVGRAPGARAFGSSAQLDAMDLRVEGRTLIIRQRSGERYGSGGGPVTIQVATPALRSAGLIGAGSLRIDRLKGLAVDLAVQGSGSIDVRSVEADRVSGAIQGSGTLSLAGKAKTASLSARGSPTVAADGLIAEQLSIAAQGSAEVRAHARVEATVAAIGTAQVKLSGNPGCTVKAIGSTTVEGCGKTR